MPQANFDSAPQSSALSQTRARSGTAPRATYETRWFIWARPQVLVYCLAQCLLYACLGSIFPEALNAAMIVIVGHLMLLASREGVSQLADQNRAKDLFSQCWVATYAFVDGGLWLVNRHSQLITGLSTEGMVGIIVLAALQAVYMRVLGLHAWARLASAACSVALFAGLPAPWSELGQPHEALGLLGAHLAGEIFIQATTLVPVLPENSERRARARCSACPTGVHPRMST